MRTSGGWWKLCGDRSDPACRGGVPWPFWSVWPQDYDFRQLWWVALLRRMRGSTCPSEGSPELAVPSRGRSIAALAIAGVAVAMMPMLNTASAAPANPWTKVDKPSVAAKSARQADVHTDRYAGYALDRPVMQTKLAPSAQEVVLPTPEGTFERFTLAESPVMEPGLAAAHPEIKTYAGKGVDDRTATVRADLTPMGFHASVRSQRGQWYVDPYFHLDQSLYASYYGHDLRSPGPLQETNLLEKAKETV